MLGHTMNGTLRPAFDLAGTLDTISGFMYTYLLVALLIGVGLYFFVLARFRCACLSKRSASSWSPRRRKAACPPSAR